KICQRIRRGVTNEVEPWRASDVDSPCLLAHRSNPCRTLLSRGTVNGGQLRHGVTDHIVKGSLRDLTAMEMNHGHGGNRRCQCHREELMSVAQHDYEVPPSNGEIARDV